MRIVLSGRRNSALTLEEVLIVVAVVMILIAIMLPARSGSRTKDRAQRIICVNNLKQIGAASISWAGDHGDKFPMEVSTNAGGTMELIGGSNAFRHFEVMSNELSTPRLLFCPAESDRLRVQAINWADTSVSGQASFLGNSNLSYFIGVDAMKTNATMLLSGDHNITNATALRNGLLELTTNIPAGWTDEIHNKQGNVGFADGSVQTTSTLNLRDALNFTGFTTNRLAMP